VTLPSIFKICHLWEGLYYLCGCKRCIFKFSSNRTSQLAPDFGAALGGSTLP
jgi:hypothetical protein